MRRHQDRFCFFPEMRMFSLSVIIVTVIHIDPSSICVMWNLSTGCGFMCYYTTTPYSFICHPWEQVRIAQLVQPLATRWTVRRSTPGQGEIFCTPRYRLWCSIVLLCNAQRVPFPGVKRLGRDVEHLVPFSADVKERVESYICQGVTFNHWQEGHFGHELRCYVRDVTLLQEKKIPCSHSH